MSQVVTLAQRLRALAKDRGATSPSAGRELERLAAEVEALKDEANALEELRRAATAWRNARGGSREEFQAKLDLVAALEELESLEAQR